MDGVLSQAFIYLCAAAIAVPIAARLGLGSVLGYLLAGIVIGPALGLVGLETETLRHYAEFGVVMMLFLVGLELQPRILWEMRSRLIGLGGLQVLACGVGIALLLLALGLGWRVSAAAGAILALSSTAIVLQSLNERGLAQTEGGRSAFSILLFQDIAVIPLIALLPLLADPALAGHVAADGHGAETPLASLPGWARAVATLGAVAVVIAAGRFAVRPALRIVARTRMREMFTVAALLLVVAIAYLMTLVGLSPALGTFLAGVVLADSEFRHELESDIEPFQGLLLGLFFITVGAGVSIGVVTEQPVLVASVAIGLIVIKAAVIYAITMLSRLSGSDRWLVALSLAQGGEFAFVLLGIATGAAVMTQDTASALTMGVTLSMLATPLFFVLHQRLIAPRYAGISERADDEVIEQGQAIVAGIGRFGQITARLLRANGVPTVVLDHDSEQVDTVRVFGVQTYYGDASRPELLHAAGIERARVLVIAIDDRDKAIALVKYVRQTFPEVVIVARAFDRGHYYSLRAAGAHAVVRELFASSLEAAAATLKAFDFSDARVRRMLQAFRRHDEETLEALFAAYMSEPDVVKNVDFINRSRAAQAELADVLARDAPPEAPDEPVTRP